MKIRWIKPPKGGGTPRRAGGVEENDEDMCRLWVEKGMAEFVSKGATTDADKATADEAKRRESVVTKPEHRAVTSPKKKDQKR